MFGNQARANLVFLQRALLMFVLTAFLVGGASTLAQAQSIYATNFENFTAKNLRGWTIDNGVWAIGNPVLGPEAAHEGTQCAGVGLNNNYPTFTNSLLSSPPMTLPKITAGQQITLRFWQWFSWATYSDAGYGVVQVQIWNGSQWGPWANVSQGYSVNSNGWMYAGTRYTPIDLSAYAGKRIHLGFFHHGGHDPAPGWYIDEVSVTKEAVVDMPLNTTVSFEDFTPTDWKGWTNHNGIWDIGTPNIGPNAAHEGAQSAGTGLNDYYPTFTNSLLASAPFTLPTVTTDQKILLNFWQWFNWATYSDAGYGQVWVSTWSGTKWNDWVDVSQTYGGNSNGWKYVGSDSASIDLTAYAGKRLRIGFFHHGGHDPAQGWYIDQVTVVLPAPVIADFTPKIGPVGTLVTVSGQFFTGVTSVLFNTTSAPFTVVNDTTLTTTVPAKASTGKITLVGPGGTTMTTKDFVVSGITLTLIPTTVLGGQANSTGIVTLAAKAPAGGTVLTLTSSDTTAATVPATVTVPENETATAFTITSLPVKATKSVKITAASDTSGTSTATLTVRPVAVGSIRLYPSTVSGGDTSLGIITLATAASTDTTVTLKSSNGNVATVPDTITIPANNTTGVFYIDTKAVAQATSVKISVKINGQTLTATLKVTP